MNNALKKTLDLGYIDTLASGTSVLHRLDPRAKLLTTLVFILMVVSYDKYSISGLLPFAVYPVALIALGGLPFGYIVKKVIFVAPLAIGIGLFNPFIDRNILLYLGPIGVSGGWLSFFSIMIRFVLTVSASLVLISLTGFNSVCESLLKFGVPKPFVVQLLLFYRYIFVLFDEAYKMHRARAVRSFRPRAMTLKGFSEFIGQLLIRSLDRAERIYLAMRCRGFDGSMQILTNFKSGRREAVFVISWFFVFLLLRLYNIPQLLGGAFK